MELEIAFKALRVVHIAAGFAGLFAAPIAMVVFKGGVAHRLTRKIYFWSMLVVALTTVAMSAYRSNVFLFLTAIFGFYLALTGYRALYEPQT